MIKSSEKQAQYIFFTIFILLQVFIILFSDSPYSFGGAENISQYQYAKYGIKHFYLFSENGVEPFYTSLLSSFTIFGYKVAEAFNLIAAVLTLILSAKISNRLYPGSSLFTIILIAFSPVYFHLATSCYPEILFSFILVAGLYLVIRKWYQLSAVVISFIPLIRFEGIIILPVFALAYILYRKYRILPLLLSGLLLFTIASYFIDGNNIWLINQLHHLRQNSLNETNGIFRFIQSSQSVFGIPLFVLIIAGFVYWLTERLRNFTSNKTNFVLFIIVSGSWITYLIFNIYLQSNGPGNEHEFDLKMAGIVPVAVITGMKLFEFISKNIKVRNVGYSVFSIIVVLQIILLFAQYKLIQKADVSELLIKKSADYIRYNEVGKKIFYFDSLVVYYLEIDPFDTTQCNRLVPDTEQPSNSMDWGDVLVWDAHYGPQYGGTQLKTLENDPYLKKLEEFYPSSEDTTSGVTNYSVQVFKKSVNKNDSVIKTNIYEQVLSFENYMDKRVKEVDGFKVWEIDSSQEYSPTISLSPDVVKRYENFDINISLHFKSLQVLNASEVLLVFSAEGEGKNIRYEKADLVSSGNKWENLQLNVKMPADIPPSSKMLVYIWNKDRKHLFMERLTVEIKSY